MRLVAIAALVCATMWGVQAQAGPKPAYVLNFLTAARAGDCAGYQGVSERLLGSDNVQPEAWVLAAGCAAQAGRLDLAERLGQRLAGARPAIGETGAIVFGHQYGMLVADAPGGGPVALRVLEPIIASLGEPGSSLDMVHAVALFAAGRIEEGRALIGDKPEVLRLYVQIDRRFAPVWKDPEALAAMVSARPPTRSDLWFSRAFDDWKAGRVESALAIMRRQAARGAAMDGGPVLQGLSDHGWTERATLVEWLVVLGRADEALEAYQQGLAGPREDRGPVQQREALEALSAVLIRADRADLAARLIKDEFRVEPFDDDDAQAQRLGELRDCAAGMAPAAGYSSWRTALLCEGASDRAVDLFEAGLRDPEGRIGVLAPASQPPEGAVLGRRDGAYREGWRAFFARSDVKAAIDRSGRILPAGLARAL